MLGIWKIDEGVVDPLAIICPCSSILDGHVEEVVWTTKAKQVNDVKKLLLGATDVLDHRCVERDVSVQTQVVLQVHAACQALFFFCQWRRGKLPHNQRPVLKRSFSFHPDSTKSYKLECPAARVFPTTCCGTKDPLVNIRCFGVRHSIPQD